ncbi:MAG: YbhB/YbcL family Raf kinase inhibitor-like protein [Methanospirillum sp.]|nr:YbhB/YbcL family Raf kinase inhibitor-like protein [Methanospirillum sp.]
MPTIPLRVILVSVCILLCGGCISSSSQESGGNIQITGNNTTEFNISVTGLAEESHLPAEYTCINLGKNPEISWTGAPEGTRSFVFILDDPDAPSGVFTHWIIYNISPESHAIHGGQVSGTTKSANGIQGLNSIGTSGYYPPCPPSGPGHRYIFSLYALDTLLDITRGDREEIDSKMNGHILDTAKLVTLFER